MGTERVIIIMGSESDLNHSKKIQKTISEFEIDCEMHISSAHKTTSGLLELLQNHQKNEQKIVYIAVAGRSNALGGVIDANVTSPVINCPPYSEKYSGLDILSSLRMPSGVAPATVLEPVEAALLAIKILALSNNELSKKVEDYQKENRKKIYFSDGNIQNND